MVGQQVILATAYLQKVWVPTSSMWISIFDIRIVVFLECGGTLAG